MKEWQFNVLFFVGVGGAVFLLLAPVFGLDAGLTKNPSAIAGVGTILTYVLTQKNKITQNDDKEVDKKDDAPHHHTRRGGKR